MTQMWHCGAPQHGKRLWISKKLAKVLPQGSVIVLSDGTFRVVGPTSNDVTELLTPPWYKRLWWRYVAWASGP